MFDLTSFFIVYILIFILWVLAVLDIVGNKKLDGTMRIVWIIIVLLIPLLGVILYFAIGRTSIKRKGFNPF